VTHFTPRKEKTKMNEQTAVEETPAIMSEMEKRILRTVNS